MIPFLLILFYVLMHPSACHNASYVIFAPREIRSGTATNVSINIIKAAGDVHVKVELLDRFDGPVLSTAIGTFKPDTTNTISLNVPMQPISYLRVTGNGGLTFKEETHISARKDACLSIYILTDKKIYKAGQTVHFRAFALHSNLTTYHGPMDIEIRDPNGNKIKQLTKVKGPKGVVSESMIMSEHPVLGDWTITASTEDLRQMKTFTVKEYVLPRFKVTVNVPKSLPENATELLGDVNAMYTYGEPVEGTAHIKSELNSGTYKSGRIVELHDVLLSKGRANFAIPLGRLNIEIFSGFHKKLVTEVTVTNLKTNRTMTGSGESLFQDRTIQLKILKSSKSTFKPGVPYELKLSLTYTDGTPVSIRNQSLRLDTAITTEEPIPSPTLAYYYGQRQFVHSLPSEHFTFPINGRLTIPVATPMNASRIELNVIFDNTVIYKKLDKFKSMNNNYIGISSALDHVTAGSKLKVNLTSTFPLNKVSYLVNSRGSIVSVGEIHGLQRNSLTFEIPTTTQMSPNAELIVYQVAPNGEISVDTLNFVVEGILSNKVFINFNTDKEKPGRNVTLTAKADPGSMVYIGVVDKSVELQQKNDFISETQISDQLDRIFPFEYVLGNDVYNMMSNIRTVNILTDAIIYKFERPYQLQYTFVPGLIPTVSPYSPSLLKLPTLLGSRFSSQPNALRIDFPDTWIWTFNMSRPDGNLELNYELPDTITTWVASAFAVSDITGLGIAKTTAEITGFQPFFASINLPSSVIRGEETTIQVTVYNYLQNDLFVFVKFPNSVDFKNIKENNGPNRYVSEIQTNSIQIRAGSAETVRFGILPETLGPIDIEVQATPMQMPQLMDRVIRKLLVVAEGVRQEKNFPVILDSIRGHNLQQNVSIVFPSNTVTGSERVVITVVGDFMGPTFNNMEQLIGLPTGCGEQTMLRLAPDVFVADYLHTTNQTNAGRLSQLKSYMEKGYQNELRFKRMDGAFSTWGDKDRSGITWLSALVLKTFYKAKEYIFIDESVLEGIVSWIIARQNIDGSFPEPGTLYNKNMKGGVSKTPHLTAYVLIALLESKDIYSSDIQMKSRLTTAISNARHYLERVINSVTDTYGMSLVSYALALSGSSSYGPLFTNLNSKAQVKGDFRFWRNDPHAQPDTRANPIEIEIASYALLSYAELNAVGDGYNVFRWLLSQRNSYGGFVSTQDTVIGLEALSKFTALIKNHNPNMNVVTSYNGISKNFTINSNNALVLQTIELKTPFPAQIAFEASGFGLTLAEVTVHYNTKQVKDTQAFDAQVNLEEESMDSFILNVCSRYLKPGSSGMAVIEVGVPSGFQIEKDDIKIIPKLRRIEEESRTLVFYFDEMTGSRSCLQMKAVRTDPITALKPSPVRVYDYYHPEDQTTIFYQSKVLQSSTLCDVCKQCRPCRRGCMKSLYIKTYYCKGMKKIRCFPM